MESTRLTTVKAVSAGALFIVALSGAALSKCVANFSPKIVRVSNALAGGILLAVTLVHMLADASDQMEEPGVAMAVFLSGNKSAEAFPLGYVLLGIGFLTILSVEVFLLEKESEAHVMEDSGSENESNADEQPRAVLPGKSLTAGMSALVGLCLHSFIAGTATGAADDMSEFSEVLIAVIAHKLFAAFSAGSLLLDTVSVRAWWTLLILLSLMTPLGIGLGTFLASSFEGAGAAALICFAAGSLLCVAVYHMLLPSLILGKGNWKKRSFLASFFGFCSMSLLAVWS
ncbi:unnamed protein product [Cladocopium goreaui]|uniref:Cell surface glycoprotein 1 n=1 Tax=Cladocopium goreaui TaxID=2562237 RepID=A0A9P1D0M0_9DINO|nr:unnamed protein product [Cladocopium goreaui]